LILKKVFSIYNIEELSIVMLVILQMKFYILSR